MTNQSQLRKLESRRELKSLLQSKSKSLLSEAAAKELTDLSRAIVSREISGSLPYNSPLRPTMDALEQACFTLLYFTEITP